MEINLNDLKKKFGLLLNSLVESGFSFENIEEKIVRNEYFMFMENNQVEKFLKTPLEMIIKEVFKKDVYIDYSKPLLSEIMWIGEMYITICANELVPIQRVVLLMPMHKMLSLFNPYHEMNNYKLVERYKEESKQSILKILATDKEFSMREISELTSINIKTLLSYQDNEKMFKASMANIYALSYVFNVPVCVFVHQSNFIPFPSILLRDDKFADIFISYLAQYLYISKENVCLVKHYSLGDKDLNKYQILFDSEDLSILKVRKTGFAKFYLRPVEMNNLLRKAMIDFKQFLPKGTLLF